MDDVQQKIGKFRITRRIGQGSMATVYQADDPYMARTVAIKVTDPRSLSDNVTRRRLIDLFFAEAKIYGLLDHRNILPVYDAGQDGERYYLVMEYIEDSRTLLPYCKPANLLPVPTAIEILHQCCKGLHYAHSRNVIHLDVKPNNIMLTPDDRVKLADFGLARILHPDADHLYLEHIQGTPTHISPERLRQEPVNHQSDIYSLGVVMFFLLTGHLPFKSPDLKELIKMILRDDPPALTHFRAEIPAEAESIVRRAMARELRDRYPDAGEMAADLNALHRKLAHIAVTAEVGAQEKLATLKKLSFFGRFFESELLEVVGVSEWLEFGPDELILGEGELDESFYVIVQGTAAVVLSGGSIPATLRTGDCFGEMAYVPRRPRAVSIRSVTSATVLRIGTELLEKVSVYCQLKFTKAFLDTLIRRLSGDREP